MRTRLYVGRLAGMAIVTFSIEAGLMSVQIDDDGYVLDTDDLAQAGAVLLRKLPEGLTITQDMIPALLHRDPSSGTGHRVGHDGKPNARAQMSVGRLIVIM